MRAAIAETEAAAEDAESDGATYGMYSVSWRLVFVFGASVIRFPFDSSIAEVCSSIAPGALKVLFHESQQRFEQRFPWVGILGDEH